MNIQTISFHDRTPIPKYLNIGRLADHQVEAIQFILPLISEDQTAVLMVIMPDLIHGDMFSLEGDCMIPVTRTLTQAVGTITAFVQISKGTEIVWHSEMLYLTVGEVPDAEAPIEAAYPGALERAIDIMAQYLSDTQETYSKAKLSEENASASDQHATQQAEISTQAASASQQSANASAASAAEAERQAQAAAQSHTDTEAAKEVAVSSRQTAETKALEASQSASAARQSEEDALLSKQSASASAQKAEEAKEIAQQYGQLVTIEDGLLIIGGE